MVWVRRGVATSTHLWPAIPGQGPASARPVQPCSSADRLPAPDYPVRGVRPPPVAGCSSPGDGGSCCLFCSDPVRGIWSFFDGFCSHRASAIPSCFAPDDPVLGSSWPPLRCAALPRPCPCLRITASPRAPLLGFCNASPWPSPGPPPLVYPTAHRMTQSGGCRVSFLRLLWSVRLARSFLFCPG